MDEASKLLERARQRTAHALQSGALQPIATSVEVIAADGVQWLVYMLQAERKQRARNEQLRSHLNPFLDPEPDLLVTNLSASHRCLLNKFNVLDTHLLITTRDFAPQLSALDQADMEALALSLDEIDGLGFYNGGTVAGASQEHRHLQLVPLPLVPGADGVPLEPLLPAADGVVPGFRFRHAFTRFDGFDGSTLHRTYNRLLDEIGVDPAHQPWNLLVTRHWMLVVARACEHWQGISVNAMGYAGSLLVRNRTELEALRHAGPLAVLETVSCPVRRG